MGAEHFWPILLRNGNREPCQKRPRSELSGKEMKQFIQDLCCYFSRSKCILENRSHCEETEFKLEWHTLRNTARRVCYRSIFSNDDGIKDSSTVANAVKFLKIGPLYSIVILRILFFALSFRRKITEKITTYRWLCHISYNIFNFNYNDNLN